MISCGAEETTFSLEAEEIIDPNTPIDLSGVYELVYRVVDHDTVINVENPKIESGVPDKERNFLNFTDSTLNMRQDDDVKWKSHSTYEIKDGILLVKKLKGLWTSHLEMLRDGNDIVLKGFDRSSERERLVVMRIRKFEGGEIGVHELSLHDKPIRGYWTIESFKLDGEQLNSNANRIKIDRWGGMIDDDDYYFGRINYISNDIVDISFNRVKITEVNSVYFGFDLYSHKHPVTITKNRIEVKGTFQATKKDSGTAEVEVILNR